MNPHHLILGVLLLVGVTLVVCVGAAIAVHVHRTARERRVALLREELSALPLAIALGGESPPCPHGRLRRAVARDLLLDMAALIHGAPRARITAWLTAEGFLAEARGQLRSTTPWRRGEAARIIGAIGNRSAEPLLIDALDDPRYSVRDAIVTALGRIGGADAATAIIGALARHRVPQGRAMGALLALPHDADAAIRAGLDHPDAQVRAFVARAVGLRRTGAAAQVLYDGLCDDDPGVRRQCAMALAAIGPYAAPGGTRTRLEELAEDRMPFVRAAAAPALAQLYPRGAAPALARLVGDPDFWVGYRAAEAMTALPDGDEIAWAVLTDARDDASAERGRVRTLEWLQRTGGVERRLQRDLSDPDRLEADLRALARAGSRAWGDTT